ncbi:MAG TPA: cytochrome P450 [Myxococcaceae bacterium]|nr:cytochrome P450 [Myxococcaceae bacterium]
MTTAPTPTQLDLRSPAIRANPYPTYARLRQTAPVAYTHLPTWGHAWLLTRYEDVANAFKDPRFASDRFNVPDSKADHRFDRWWLPRAFRIFKHLMVAKDAPTHTRLRNLVHKAFTPRMVEKIRGDMEQVTERLLDAAEKKGDVNLIEDFALPLPVTIISQLLGVPAEDQNGFHRRIGKFLSTNENTLFSLMGQVPNMINLHRFLLEIIDLRRVKPQEDLLTALVQAEEQGDRLNEDELVSMVFLLLLAGYETTVNLIGNGTLALLEHPDQLQKLREEPGHIGTAIEELLRYGNPSEQPSPRHAMEDIPLHGQVIPRGSVVVPIIASANRDETVFKDADRVDITRNPNRHLSFGLGAHYCVGAPLARMEGQIAISALVRRFPRMRLAVPLEQLQWSRSLALHGLKALPLHLT